MKPLTQLTHFLTETTLALWYTSSDYNRRIHMKTKCSEYEYYERLNNI